MLFKKKEITKAKYLQLRVTDAEKAQLKKIAAAKKMSVSEYLLRTGLGRPILKSNTSELVVELIRLGRQQKELHAVDHKHENQYLEILKAIVEAIKSIPFRIASEQKKQR